MKHKLECERKTLTVVFPGDVVSSNAAALQSELFALLESPAVKRGPWDRLEADLTAAKMVDSVGLNLLVTVVRTLTAEQKKMQVSVTALHVERALKFTRLDRLMEIRVARA
jgi:anti-anti-sigma factor